uniref:Capsid protein n=1 Tax=Stapleton virus TaxID=2600331 RepID=A0A5B8XBY8_9VIRU|nr:hypothetical protein 3 [Stapleton virus]
MEQLQREIQSLTDKINALKTSGKKKNSKKPKGQTTPNPSVTQVSGGSGRKRKRARATVSNNVGTVTLNRKEMVLSVSVGNKTGNGTFDIKPSSFSFLKQFSMFDKIKWNKMHISYRPGVGTTFNGMISYGVLWDHNKTSATRDQISALTPNNTHALWYDGQACPMVLPKGKLQSRPWFTPNDSDLAEQGPGRFFYSATAPDVSGVGQVVGEFWADYSVTMTGTGFS